MARHGPKWKTYVSGTSLVRSVSNSSLMTSLSMLSCSKSRRKWESRSQRACVWYLSPPLPPALWNKKTYWRHWFKDKFLNKCLTWHYKASWMNRTISIIIWSSKYRHSYTRCMIPTLCSSAVYRVGNLQVRLLPANCQLRALKQMYTEFYK